MKAFISILFFMTAFMLTVMLMILCNSTNFKYPDPFNYKNYGFVEGKTYVRTSYTKNPFTSKNGSNKDTLTLVSVKGRWMKFNNEEMFEFHSDSLNLYQWEVLK